MVDGAMVRTVRVKLGRSGRAVAADAGISHQRLSQIETGTHPIAQPYLVQKLAAVLKVPVRVITQAAIRC